MKIKAISLVSGGLDSTLATKVVLDQGVEVIAANFVSPFCRCDKVRFHAQTGDNQKGGDRRESRVLQQAQDSSKDGEQDQTTESRGCRHEAKFVSEQLGIPLKIVNVTKDFLEVLKSPKHGYGSNINPCIDCRILMLKKAKELMTELGASFLITGEVLGQRPMSQRRDAMNIIENEAGVKGIVLRPLSAKLLEPTIPEEKGWVDRQKLLDINGRSRKTQMQMAEDYNIKDYPCPAGGCLLTDPSFSRRIKDLINHDELTMEDIQILNHGRYFRLSDKAKLIVGKNEHENEKLEMLAGPNDLLLKPQEEVSGASGLGRGDFSDKEMILLASRVVSRYFDRKEGAQETEIIIKHQGKTDILKIVPFSDEEAKKYIV